MLGIFNVLMWYFLLVLYMGQIRGVFGKYEPLTYRTGCTLWGVFIVSSLGLNLLCIIVAMAAVILTVVELSKFKTVSYKNYGQAKLGREVSRVLLVVYHLEIVIALTHAICTCGTLAVQRGRKHCPLRMKKRGKYVRDSALDSGAKPEKTVVNPALR
ncbi:membrane-spanning 4-domains subfamily A member 13 [Erethizon dorsatum]